MSRPTTARTAAADACVVFDPATGFGIMPAATLSTKTDREADYWGAPSRAEIRAGRAGAREAQSLPQRLFHRRRRRARHRPGQHACGQLQSATVFTYKETLDTTYVGGYIGFGGEYSFGFIPGVKNVGGLYDRLGLRTFINPRVPASTTPTPTMTAVSPRAVQLVQDLQVERRARLHRHHLARDPQADRHAHQPVAVDRLRVHLLGAQDALRRRSGRPDADRRRGGVRQPHHAPAEYRASAPRSSTKSR